MGAYPQGQSATTSSDNGNDDDNVETMATTGLVFGVVAFVVGGVALGLFLCYGVGGKKDGALLG
jgi:hypothetical protein